MLEMLLEESHKKYYNYGIYESLPDKKQRGMSVIHKKIFRGKLL